MSIHVSAGARRALYLLFLIPGLTMATWVTRTPALRDGLAASTEQMGLILFGFSAGAMSGILSAGPLVARLGSHRLTLIGLLALPLSLCVLAAGSDLLSMAGAFAGLFIFGLGMGWAEIAVNIEGAAVERASGRSIMTTLHGFFSLGTLLGALAGMAMTALEVPLGRHLWTIALLSVLLVLALIGNAPRLSEQESTGHANGSTAPLRNLLADRRLLLICFVVLAMALAEGAANDWLPLLMIDGHGFAHTAGTLIYVVFTLGMTLGRFAGGRVVERLGRAATLRGSALIGALSLGLIVFCDIQWIAASAVVLWGLGASLGFPLAISAAGDSGRDSDQRVRVAATAGYMAFLVGPPLLGFIGEHFGLRLAMLPVLGLVAMAFVVASALQDRPGKQAVV
ncbi:MFS transporter [Pseudomonas putida]|uniref:Inner membrane protein YbjJ n=1 Tax=Pseudomonas putida TaxID=303 RepID=A0A1Q9R032_PSEPU|nr:MFS transporter [Pseudomonas putida]OLS60770.1 Inner membrane protein YbjJ [Pseudomonas putida]